VHSVGGDATFIVFQYHHYSVCCEDKLGFSEGGSMMCFIAAFISYIK